MMDGISSVLTTVSSLMTLSKDISNAKTDHEIAVKTGELNERLGGALQQLIAAQTSYLTLLSEKGDLEAEIAQLKRWEQEKERYQLHKTDAGGFLYRLKSAEIGIEPEHDICAQCYENGIKSILQSAPVAHWCLMLTCHRCSSSVQVKSVPVPSPIPRRTNQSSRLDRY